MANILKGVGYVIIAICFLAGIGLGREAGYGSFVWEVAVVYWIGGAVSGILFIAFGGIYGLFEENNRYLRQLAKTHDAPTQAPGINHNAN